MSDVGNTSMNDAIRDADAMSRVTEKIAITESQMLQAFEEVEKAGKAIAEISRTIEDFARHTRIIAVNAAIEATRAGGHGAAFGIVAEEIEQLARQSNDAAVQVRSKVEDSMKRNAQAITSSREIAGMIDEIRTLHTSLERSLSIANNHTLDLESLLKNRGDKDIVDVDDRLSYDEKIMSTGVVTVDDQHKALIDAINGLDDAVREGRGKDEITAMLDFMADYVVNHFKHEEEVMDRKKCPKAAINKAAHQQLLKKYTEWRAEFDRTGASLEMVGELHGFLRQWLVGHICKVDTCLKHPNGSAVTNAAKFA